MNKKRRIPFLFALVMLLSLTPSQPVSAGTNQDTIDPDAKQTLYIPAFSSRKPACHTSETFSPYGVQMYGGTGAQSDNFDAMMELDVHWVRVPVYWDNVEPTNRDVSKFWWGRADNSVEAAVDGCKRVIITLKTAPAWAAQNPESVINPGNLKDFEDYVTAVVERYDGDGVADAPGSPMVMYWELYNEPDASDDLIGYEGWGDYPVEYVEMLKRAYRAVKKANPDAQVLMGGIAHDWFQPNGPFVETWIEDVLAAGAGQYFDIFNFHSYPSFSERWIMWARPNCSKGDNCFGPGLVEKTNYMRELLAQYQLGDVPIIITETGWYSDTDISIPSTPEIQARYMTELSVQTKAAGIEAMIEFALVDPDSNPHAYGLLTKAGDRKLAFHSYKLVIERMRTATFEHRLSSQETGHSDLDAYRFIDNNTGGVFYVSWLNPVENDIKFAGLSAAKVSFDKERLRVPGNKAEVYDIYGTHVKTIIGTFDRVDIYVSSQPLYIYIVE